MHFSAYRVLMVGGVFDETSGRSSGYFSKLSAALAAVLPGAQCQTLNGGSYALLAQQATKMTGITHLLWFADVPNHLPKLLPSLRALNPGMLLVSSKNNRKGLYDQHALRLRMQAADAELLLEFQDGPAGLLATLHNVGGESVLERCGVIEQVAAGLAHEFARVASLRFPLDKAVFATEDSMSFAHRNLQAQTEVPLSAHPGAFGVTRKNHTHEGVDLYGEAGDEVRAMESGTVVCRRAFTGPAAGSPWWGATECVLVAGASGVLNYGEITPREGLQPGDCLQAGELVGHLATVLLKDKGRPRTMLHLERYTAGTLEAIAEWPLGIAQPEHLLNPTALLLQAAGVRS